MATIPLEQKVFMVDNGNNTIYGGSAALKAMQKWYTMQDIADSVGGGLEGTQYVYVAANGTDLENAVELQAAYDLAKTMSPSITKRITVVAAPGNYNFGAASFTMDTQYIDLVTLDGNRSAIVNTTSFVGLAIGANDVFVKGVDVVTKMLDVIGGPLTKLENCRGGDYSYGYMSSGTFINCVGGDDSFGTAGGIASGTFVDCTGGAYSFGGFSTASGTFTNCTARVASFGYGGAGLSGTCVSCVSDLYGTVSGKLYFCRQTPNGNALPIIAPNSAGKIVAFITKDNNFIAQQP